MMLHKIEPRFLMKADAARYCGLQPAAFARICPVPAIRLADKLLRWDRHALDRWLDGIMPEKDDWLEKIADDAATRRIRRARPGG